LEYLSAAVRCFYTDGDRAARKWVHERCRQVLGGDAKQAAAAIRRKATTLGLETRLRSGADACARYLTNKAPYLGYPAALGERWPIASGVIEGACR
jgi:hypothetical protein